MLKHILKLIWNERKLNAWIIAECILVFSILWFCCDYLTYMTKRYLEPKGFDITHTYKVDMKMKDPENVTIAPDDRKSTYQAMSVIIDRIKNHPSIEAVSLSLAASPYTGSSLGSGYIVDTSDSTFQYGPGGIFTSDFLKVFRIPLLKGDIAGWDDQVADGMVLINGNENDNFGVYSIDGINTLHEAVGDQGQKFTVKGVLNKTKDTDDRPYHQHVYKPVLINQEFVFPPELSVRVYPEADNDFIEKFSKDMRDQLEVDVYSLGSIVPYNDVKRARMRDTNSRINGVYAITGFLIINVFLGIIGTFWFRTQSRINEIGLRMAIGSSKKKLMRLLMVEACIIVFIASIVGTIISLNLGQTDILSSLGIPIIDRNYANVASAQDVINYLVTFGFILLIALAAILYPAYQATKIQPAQALHEE